MGVNQRENLFVAIVKSVRKRVSMSLSLRVATNYFKYMLVCGLLFFSVFAICYMITVKKPYDDQSETVISKLESGGITMSEAETFLAEKNMYMRITGADGITLFSNIPYSGERLLSFMDGFRVVTKDGSTNLVFEKRMSMDYEGEHLTVLFCYTLTQEFYQMLKLLGILVVAYLAIQLSITKKSRDNAERMLQPIKDMTSSMERMTINTLESERLKPYEMITELQELADVFNAMLERLEESYESQKIFVSNASHELRTPIAVIQGYAGMLERWGSSDEAILKESIDAIMHESKDMQELVEKLLFLSRHDKKTLKLEKDVINVRSIVEDLMKETQMVVKGRNFEYPLIEDVSIFGDKQSIKQLLRIFVDNAVKYTEENDTIKVSCRNARGNLVLVIEDTGIGMSREDMGKIFERFFRSDEVRGKNISGHGLGLSIAKLIVASHNGNIHVSSKLGEGTTFIITIPKGIK